MKKLRAKLWLSCALDVFDMCGHVDSYVSYKGVHINAFCLLARGEFVTNWKQVGQN